MGILLEIFNILIDGAPTDDTTKTIEETGEVWDHDVPISSLGQGHTNWP
jgi:hypothetical protein